MTIFTLARERCERVRRSLGRLARVVTCGLLLLTLVVGRVASAEELKRKVIARTAPSYPELAKRMHLSGKVKLEVTINAAGSVTSAKLVGGSPVFEQSAVDAVKQWRFEAADKETKAQIVLEFAEPQNQ